MARGEKFTSEGRLDSALACYERAEAGFFTANDRPERIQAIIKVASVFWRQSSIRQADSIACIADNLARSQLGDTSRVLAEAELLLGTIRAYRDQFADALACFDNALSIRRVIFGGESGEAASVYWGMGFVYERKGDLARAEHYYERACSLYEKGSFYWQVAYLWSSLGGIYSAQGRIREAIELLHKSDSLLAEIRLESSDLGSGCAATLALCYRSDGQFDSATVYARKSLSISLAVHGKCHMSTAIGYSSLADCLTAIGDFDSGEQYQKEALEIADSLGMSGTYSALQFQHHLARLFVQKGEFVRAAGLLESTLAKASSKLGETHLEVGVLCEDLAEAYTGMGSYDLAKKSYLQAIRIRRLSRGGSDIAQLQWKLGLTYAALQSCDSALASYDSATVSLGTDTEMNRLLRSRILRNIGDCRVQLGDARGGLAEYQRSIAFLVASTTVTDIRLCPGLPDVTRCPDYIQTLSARAAALGKAGFAADSTSSMVLATYERMADALSRVRRYYSLEGSKFRLEGKYQEVYAAGLETALRQYQRTDEPRYKDLAFRFAEGNRAAALGDALARLQRASTDSLASERWRAQRELIALQDAMERNEVAGDSSQVAALRGTLMTRLQRIDSLSRKEQSHGQAVFTIDDLRSILGANDCLIEYVVRDSEVVAFVVRNDSSFITSRRLAYPLDGTVRMMLQGITTLDRNAYIANANELSTVLFAPVRRFLANRTRIIIIPDGILNYLPFGTLFTQTVTSAEAARGYGALPYLLKRYEISHASSSQVYASSVRSEATPASKERSFVGFAPVFQNTTSAPLLASRSAASDFRSVSVDGKTYQTLPHSRNEVMGIADLFRKKGYEGKYVVGCDATKGRFESLSANYGIVHIATHGYFDEEHPQFSGLLFAPRGDSVESRRDVLFAGEAYELNVKDDLVVLSSCQSGLGKMVTGEGIVGLTRGFLYSGARDVLYSLWDIRDRNTPELMLAFYRHLLAGESCASALRSAKLSMIRDPRTATPLLWAGFVLAGP